MKSRTEIRKNDVINNQRFSTSTKMNTEPDDLIKINNISEILTSEGTESFRHYIEWLGITRDPRLVVLSSIHHYYYDAEEMKNVKSVVNLKELNHIKEIENFLLSMYQILPPKCYFIGCFVDSKKQNGFSFKKNSTLYDSKEKSEAENIGISSRIPFLNTIFNFLDLKTNKYLTPKNVSLLLRNSGFKVIDMTELEGLTYFCAQNLRTTDN